MSVAKAVSVKVRRRLSESGNVRLAAHLTGYRIDIKSASEFEAMEEAGSVELEAENDTVEE